MNIINLSGEHIFRDIETVMTTFRYYGGKAMRVSTLPLVTYRFISPAMTHIITPSFTPKNYVAIDDGIRESFRKLTMHPAFKGKDKLLVVQFKPAKTYKAFSWDYVYTPNSVLSLDTGKNWDFSSMLWELPKFIQEV